MRCASCGQESPDGFRFCGNCGAPFSEPTAPAREVRKVVTVVFCDLSGSTALGEGTDPEALRARMRGYYEGMRTILERHGGTVEKFIGDAVMAVFGVPVAHEDDALRAVRSAWEMREAVSALGLVARIGTNTGEVVAGEGDTLVTGDAVNVAARLEQLAAPGEVLIGEETRRLVRDAVRVELVQLAVKGKAEPVTAFRLLAIDLEAAAIARRLDGPLVGRHPELAQLRQAFERVVRERRCSLFTLLGAAGIGKSRLTAEFLFGLDATVLEGRCLGYGEGITFWPVVSILKQLGARAEDALARLIEGASTPNELFWAIRAQLEEVAQDRPLVVVFDDVHWGEETFLDLIDHIADLSRGAPLLLLCLARPDLLEKRPAWGGGKLNAATILLEPLTAEQGVELIEAHGGIESVAKERIVAAADGNPLFIEEMLALVREDGDVRVPATVQALLQARLDQLGLDERTVIESGAVEGQLFHQAAVVELTHAPDIGSQLMGLVRKELIQPATATVSGDQAFRFRHLLIRDAAYDALPKDTRAELHERFADWLEVRGQELIELDEVLGYHLEQAARYRRELERPDLELERRAGLRLATAGSKAALRSDAHGSANLLRRALALLPRDDPTRPVAIVDQLAILEDLAQTDERLTLIQELEEATDPAVRMQGRVARSALRIMTEPFAAVAEAEAVAQEALALFIATGNHLGAAHAYSLDFWTSWIRSQAVPTLSALERLLDHARAAGARVLADRAMMGLIGPLSYGPFEPPEIRAHLVQLQTEESPLATMNALFVDAELARRDRRYDDALGLLQQSSSIERELGLDVGSVLNMQRRADVLRDAGRLDESIATYREALTRLEELGQTSFRSTTLINFATALYTRGEVDEAARLAVEGEDLGAAEDVVNFAYGRALRARIAADQGTPDAAEVLAREALAYAYETDFPTVHATAHEALAHVLLATGRLDEARDQLQHARQLWQRYGHLAEAERTGDLLTTLDDRNTETAG